VPWRCHTDRSLIADALVVRGIRVEEIVSAKGTRPHAMTPFARVNGTAMTYPPEAVWKRHAFRGGVPPGVASMSFEY
jgi:hypothetical protein